MASKGICCAAQAAGDLGKPLIITVHRKDGSTYQRCGTCEVAPSCRNPQKLVFVFRFLKGVACGIAGAAKCGPTAQGVSQYNQERSSALSTGQRVLLEQPPLFPATGAVGSPYSLPLS